MVTTLHTETDEHGVLTVRFDQAEKSTNTLSPTSLGELEALIESLTKSDNGSQPTGVVFTSAKPDSFLAGADLFELARMDTEATERFIEQGQRVINLISRLPMVTVAAINGHCLGGGLELALACTWRVAADRGSINIGLPEIKLGIIPAWGGTTRLTRMLGPGRALPLLLSGATMSPRRARKAQFVDDVVRPEALAAAARRWAGVSLPRRGSALVARHGRALAPWSAAVCAVARRRAAAKTFGNYPAVDALIDTASTACRRGVDAGLRAERQAVSRLAQTDACRNLMRLFFLRHDAQKSVRHLLEQDGSGSSAQIQHAAVIGGGTMGAEIAHSLARSGIAVRLVEINADAVGAALRRIRKSLDHDVKSCRISPLQAQQAMDRVSPTSHYTGLRRADLVIEAVAETMSVKRKVFEELDRQTRLDAVLASNTSSLSIRRIAEATDCPGRVIGLHFFNPVAKMPLVEVVHSRHSDERVLAAGAELAMRLGKTPILVADGPGFLVNRVLIPYLAEAMVLASQGVSIEMIDHAMKAWGMPMGPFELLDQVGLDVTGHILESLRATLGDHIVVPDGIDQVIERGWLGRKTGRGFYVYRRRGRPQVHRELLELISNGREATTTDAIDIDRRLVLPMVNEAARLLDEGVTHSTATIDLATVLGLGLAPFRGGLIRFAETYGLASLVADLQNLAEEHGPRFAPVDSLIHVADSRLPLQAIADHRAATADPIDDRPAATSGSRQPVRKATTP